MYNGLHVHYTSNFTEIIKSQPIQKYLKYIKENQIKGCPVNRRKQ